MKQSLWRQRMERIIFEADTPWGKLFDVFLIAAIVLSVLAVMLESVPSFRVSYGKELLIVEWFFTFLFTIEYICRLVSSRSPKKYLFSFFGLIDFIAIVPSYMGLFFVGAQTLLVVRSFRLLRVFRVFKLTQYLTQANHLTRALNASRPKITVFLVGVMATVTTMGALMYMIEGAENGFTSIPRSVYWAIVTMTTVGYGDISPQTAQGQFFASVLMILGYGVLAVPTGIVSVELSRVDRQQEKFESRSCQACRKTGHDENATFCKFCGTKLL